MKVFEFQNGDKMPMLGLGTWKAAPGQVYDAVREAIKIGYRHFDCAAIYRNEEEIGQAFEDVFAAGEVTREELWITSKLWNNAHGEENVLSALQKTLADLRLSYLDLYLIHWPVALKPEVLFPESGTDFFSLEEKPIANTWKGMENVVKAGLTRHIGVSNFTINKLKQLLNTCDIRPEMNQIEMHPFLQQPEMIKYCQEQHIFLTAYSPLGSGDRPDILKSSDEVSLLENEVIMRIAEAKGCSPAQVLIQWALERGTAVIPKSANPVRLKQNFESTTVQLGPDDMNEIARLDQHARYIKGIFWTMPESPYTVEELWDE
ncbi:aldo/keto reductase [Fulvivirgaceae bacterium BMA12]|uniref:Aldo/keto reductase n=1 Tax=Agaribacillus aureus TaxID=3051825 RepID=A0ABT8KZ44_9BACT|nr:aldo/keto reductase [Fulvivirgaceae bacterium BMA12]